MKKFLVASLLFFLPSLSHAFIGDEGVTRIKTVDVHFSTTVIVSANPASFLLISLSTTTGLFPHQDTGEIDISHINVEVDKLAATTGTVKIGVVTFVNTSTACVTFFYSRSFAKNVSNTAGTTYPNLTPSFYRCKVKSGRTSTNADVNGTTPFILSNDVRNSTFIYNSTTAIPSPITASPIQPRAGDIIMEVTNADATNTFTVFVDLLYHSEP